MTGDVISGMEDFVSEVAGIVDIGKISLLDVGCNDGSLLDTFSKKGTKVTVGIEPTDAAKDANPDHFVIQAYFDEQSAEELVRRFGLFDVVTFTNVFAHIEDLSALLRSIQTVLAPDGILVIENHYLARVMETFQFDTFYHEHPRTYSLKSFSFIADSLGRSISRFSFPERYGGNIRVVIGSKAPQDPFRSALEKHMESERGEILSAAAAFSERLSDWIPQKKQEIHDLVLENGPLLAKAAPGRASIPCKLLQLSTDEVAAVYEKPASQKIGHYLPGTRIPIFSDDTLLPLLPNLPIILNMAWHIPREIRDYLGSKGYRGQLVSLV